MPRTQLPYRRPSWRLRAIAVLAALLLHVAAILFVRFPFVRSSEDVMSLVFLTDLEEIPPPLVAPGSGSTRDRETAATPEAVDASTATGSAAMASGSPTRSATRSDLATAIPFLPEPVSAAGATRLPFTVLTEAHAATLPLIVSPVGGIGRRRLERTAEQMATARAESLLFARMEGIGVAPARNTGAVGLANGGITVAVPWQGFLPSSRSDGTWRKERCSGDGDGKSDKAGEGEARRAQCG